MIYNPMVYLTGLLLLLAERGSRRVRKIATAMMWVTSGLSVAAAINSGDWFLLVTMSLAFLSMLAVGLWHDHEESRMIKTLYRDLCTTRKSKAMLR
jgi:hypothetical protein